MISTMGDANGNGKGDFLLVDAEKGVAKGEQTISGHNYFKKLVGTTFMKINL